MLLSRSEAESLFRKWRDEKTPLDAIVNVGAIRGSLRGILTHVESEFVVVNNPLGQIHILLTGATSFNYEDAREGPASAKERYPKFISGLQLYFDLGECIFAELDLSASQPSDH
ncbi:MAG: hypothetical protein V7641_1114 [Blastocatellia bacterium]